MRQLKQVVLITALVVAGLAGLLAGLVAGCSPEEIAVRTAFALLGGGVLGGAVSVLAGRVGATAGRSRAAEVSVEQAVDLGKHPLAGNLVRELKAEAETPDLSPRDAAKAVTRMMKS